MLPGFTKISAQLCAYAADWEVAEMTIDIERLNELLRFTAGLCVTVELDQLKLVEDLGALIRTEIERQNITDVDVQKAIEYLKPIARHPITANRKHLETAITALDQMDKCDSCKDQMDFVKEHTLANDLFRELQETKDTLAHLKAKDEGVK